MIDRSRRKLFATVLTGARGLALAARVAERKGLVPPEWQPIYGPGDTMTYAAHRLLTGNALAREFSREQISQVPFANEIGPPSEEFSRLRASGFADWRLAIDGMLARPKSLSLAELRSYPSGSQITQLACEEGWSYIAEWIGVPLRMRMPRQLGYKSVKFINRITVTDSVKDLPPGGHYSWYAGI